MDELTRRHRECKRDEAQQKLFFGPSWDELRRQWRGIIQGMPAARCGLSRRRWHNVQRLLLAVLWFDQNGDGCWAGTPALCAEADLSRSTLGRAKRDALELGVIGVQRRSNPGPFGGRLTDRLKVHLEGVAALGSDEARRQSGEVTTHSDAARTQSKVYIEEEAPDLSYPSRDGSRATAEINDWADDEIARVWSIRAKLIGKVGPFRSDNDLMDATKAVLLSLKRFNEHWLWDAAEAVAAKRPSPSKPWAYFRRCLCESTRDRGEDLNVVMARTRVPPHLIDRHQRPTVI